MGTNNLIYLEILEWFDETGQELVHRLPEKGSGEIKFGAQLIVRESQAAVFFYQGKAVGAFGPGRHTLKTANIPILTKIASLPWAMESPLKAEVFFANLKTFTNLKWGTRDPVAFKDNDLGLVRLRAFGVFNLKIVQPVLFINTLAGTQGIYTSADISDYLNQVVVSRFNDYIGEKVSSIFDLPEHYDELGKGLTQRLREDFSAFGLALTHLYINAVTPPPEVQQAIDDKSRLGLFDDMNKLMQMKTAMAMEKIAENPQGIASDGAQAGLGLGLGMMLPGMFSQQVPAPAGQPAAQTTQTTACPECQNKIPQDAKFCPQCGHQQVIFARCQYCSKNITPGTKYCPRCGKQVVEKTKEKICSNCGAKICRSLFSATSAEKNISYAVQHQCPQCGAPATLGEETRFFVCEFCRVRSCISQKGFPRYYLPCSPKVPQDAQLIYLPYWRFKGVRYMCTASGVTPRFTDISTLAVADMPPQIPFSLGLRPQAMPMKLIRPDTQGKFFRPLPSAMVLKGKTFDLKQAKHTFQEDIGETFSLIYSPFYIRQQHLVDGVLNQALPLEKQIPPGGFDLDQVHPGIETHFIAGICPGCGADLEGSGDSLVLVCRNCHSLWRAKEEKLAKIKFKTAAPDHKDDIMVPFWRISAKISPINLSSHADLARMANLPLAIPREWEKKPVHFWSPAFKVRPNIFLRLLGQLTSTQLEPALSHTVEDNLYQPINLPASEAIQTIRITISALLKPRKEILEILPRIDVAPQNVSLIFLPFKSSGHDITHPDLGIGINKKALALSDNL